MLLHTRGLLTVRDELAGWVGSHDAYRTQGRGDRQAWLSLWSGGALKIDRKSADPILVPRPAVSVVGGIQPDVLPALRGDAAADDGFLDRLLVCWPPARAPRWTEAAFPEEPLDRLAKALKTLRGLPPSEGEATVPRDPPTTEGEATVPRDPPSTEGEATVVRLSPEARRVWIAWHDSNAEAIERGSGLGAGFAAKLVRHVPRLALLLHVAANPDVLDRPLAVETMEAAIELGEHFRVEHGRMLAAMGAGGATEPAGVPGRVLRQLRRAAVKADESEGWLARAELLHALGNLSAGRLDTAIAALQGDGLIESRTVETATKPREEYRVVERPFVGFEGFEASRSSRPDSPNTTNLSNPTNGCSPPGVLVCAGCGLPRSGDRRSCPSCGTPAVPS